MILVWAEFVALAMIIGFAGYRLCYYADEIADSTGLAKNWIGLILLATITSLPELMTGVSAVRFAGDPNLAVGDVVGSCVFNLTLVFILDLIYKEGSVYGKATRGHILSGALGMILISYFGFSLIVSKEAMGFRIGHVGGYVAIIPIFYMLAMRTLYSFEQTEKPANRNPQSESTRAKLRDALTFFALAALVVIAAGIALPFVGESLIQLMGWNSAFVGTLFMAFATSLPEIAVTISAIRMRSVELAFSNVLGSNLFNVVILAIDDFFYWEGPILEAVSPVHTVTAFSAVMMTGLVLTALIQPPQKKVLNSVSVLSILLVLIYSLNAYVVFSN